MKKRKTIVIVLAILLIFITVIGCVIYKIDSKTQLKSIKSKSQLSKIYKGESTNWTFIAPLRGQFIIIYPFSAENELRVHPSDVNVFC